jgi:XTP/dITP diphosphohydrolase|tara:strand:- start:133 stop:735 length:603 start_codon:yes stop_codon:yes gene_type:complete
MLNKKITKILIGTNNAGKIKEIKDLLPKSLKIYSTKDLKIKSPIENGDSFLKNSLIKAQYYSKKSKMICLSDDSGLEIDILDGAPGIHSARWGGKNNNFDKAINRIFKEITKKNKNWQFKKVSARFICALTIYWPNGKIINSLGKVKGHISFKKKGKNGFGYDPIFRPLNKKKTFGEMLPKEKYKIDHRFKAFKKIRKFF